MSNYGLYISGVGKTIPNVDLPLSYIAKYDNTSFVQNQTSDAESVFEYLFWNISFTKYNNQLYGSGYGSLFKYDFVNNTAEFLVNKDTDIENTGPENDTEIAATVTCLTVYDGDLYFGGFLDYVGEDVEESKLYFAKFNSDGKYTNLSTTKGFNQDKDLSDINTLWNMTVYNDDLYISGVKTKNPNDDEEEDWNIYFGRYNASKNEFTDLSNKIQIGNDPIIQAMIVYDGDLYICGFSDDEENWNIYFGRYNASKNEFTDLSNILPNDSLMNTMIVYDGDLYIGGYILYSGDNYIQYVAKYDKKNNKVDSITKGLITNKSSILNTMSVYDGNLYIGGGDSSFVKDDAGSFPNIDYGDDMSSQYVAKYNKTDNSFTPITGGLVTDKGSSIISMYNFEEDKKSNLALIIGLSVAGGVVVLAVIFFLLYKFVF